MEEIRKREDIILFIDEIMKLLVQDLLAITMDAGNILKPALARGEYKWSVPLLSMNTASWEKMLP